MMDAQRALLDELMGAARNLTDEEKKGYKEIRWNDDEVCSCFLVRFCPHDLFVNTKSNLGPCPKIHDQKLKESFEKSPLHNEYVLRFEAELARFCERLVSDLERKLKKGRIRIAQDQETPPLLPLSSEKAEQLSNLEEKMKKLLEQIEALGEEGKIDEAQALMKKVDLINAEKTALIQQAYDRGHLSLQEKKMSLCETCGSFLVENDAAERTQSHVTGKQHIGYNMVRDYLTEYNSKKNKDKTKSDEDKKHTTDRAREHGREPRRDGRERESRERGYRFHERDRYDDKAGRRDRGHRDLDTRPYTRDRRTRSPSPRSFRRSRHSRSPIHDAK